MGLVWKGQLDLVLDKPEDSLKLDTTGEWSFYNASFIKGLLVQPQCEQEEEPKNEDNQLAISQQGLWKDSICWFGGSG